LDSLTKFGQSRDLNPGAHFIWTVVGLLVLYVFTRVGHRQGLVQSNRTCSLLNWRLLVARAYRLFRTILLSPINLPAIYLNLPRFFGDCLKKLSTCFRLIIFDNYFTLLLGLWLDTRRPFVFEGFRIFICLRGWWVIERGLVCISFHQLTLSSDDPTVFMVRISEDMFLYDVFCLLILRAFTIKNVFISRRKGLFFFIWLLLEILLETEELGIVHTVVYVESQRDHVLRVSAYAHVIFCHIYEKGAFVWQVKVVFHLGIDSKWVA
jgi:hypothetical protein